MTLVAVEAPLRGQAAPPSLTVECSALDDNHRSALEARALAELAASPPPGEVIIECASSSAVVTYRPKRGAATKQSVSLREDQPSAVDDLLAAMSFVVAKGREAPPSPDPSARNLVTIAPPKDTTAPSEKSERSRPRIGILAGVDAELWQGAPEASIGPRVGVGVVIPSAWSISLSAAYGWGIGSPNGVDARCLGAGLELAYAVIPQARVGLGFNVRQLLAHLPQSNPSDSNEVTVGVTASARYVLRFADFALSAGPRLEMLAEPLAVELDGDELFRIPRWVAGFSLEGSFEIGGL